MTSVSWGRTLGLLDEGRRQGLHRGGQLYVSRRGAVLADLAFGESRPGFPVAPDSLMLWMSSCKPITAVAIAVLWEAGSLALDDRVARHIPEFAQGGKEAITVRHLLTHTGGFRMLDVGWPDRPWGEILDRICAARREPRWTPGEKAGYHRESSWFVLGELIQRLSRVPYRDFLRREIFAPLGLEDCGIGVDPDRHEALRPRLVAMWDTTLDEPREHGWDLARRAIPPNPGSNGYGPISGLGRFYEMLLAGGTLDGRRILSPQTVEALAARHRTGMLDQTFRHVMDWGLGFIPNPSIYGDASVPYAYGPHASRRAFGHSGYRSSTAFADPEHHLVVALAVNGTPDEAAHARRFTTLLASVYEDLGLGSGPASPGDAG